MNIMDIGIILLFILSFIIGFKRGVLRQVVTLVGIVLTYVIAYNLKGYLGDFFCQIFPFSQFSGAVQGLTTLNIIIYELIAFILIFGVIFTIYEVILNVTKIFQKIIDMTIVLTIPSKLLGGLVSLLEGYILIFVALIVLAIPLRGTGLINNSIIANKMIYSTPVLSSASEDLTDSISETINLVDKIANKKISIDEANKQLLKIEINYKIINPRTAYELNKRNKISIKNIEDIIER